MYTLDTNAIIYYLEGQSNVVLCVNKIFQSKMSVYISTVTEAELFSFWNLASREAEGINSFLRLVSIIHLDSHLARGAGQVRRLYGLKLADSIIAATALFTGTTLLTRNIKDFKRVPNLALQKI